MSPARREGRVRDGSKTDLEVRSIVMSARVAERLDLQLLMAHPVLRKHAERHSAFLGLRLGPRKVFIAVHATGRVHVRGAKSSEEGETTINELRRWAGEVSPVFPAPMGVEVNNIVFTAALDDQVDLNAMSASLPESDYEPEQFPGLIMPVGEKGGTVLVFQSGKLVLTGFKTREAAERALRLVDDAARRTRV